MEQMSKSTLYRRTPKGYVGHLYYILKRRADAKGYKYPPRAAFNDFAFGSALFLELFDAYKERGFKFIDAPSVDRINPEKGYELDNIQWLTTSQNSRKYHAYIRKIRKGTWWDRLKRLFT